MKVRPMKSKTFENKKEKKSPTELFFDIVKLSLSASQSDLVNLSD